MEIISKTVPSSKTHLTSADAVADVLSFGDVAAVTDIDGKISQKWR